MIARGAKCMTLHARSLPREMAHLQLRLLLALVATRTECAAALVFTPHATRPIARSSSPSHRTPPPPLLLAAKEEPPPPSQPSDAAKQGRVALAVLASMGAAETGMLTANKLFGGGLGALDGLCSSSSPRPRRALPRLPPLRLAHILSGGRARHERS